MKCAAFKWLSVWIVGIGCSLAPTLLAAGDCKCPHNPGPGGGVQCAKDQIATCDPSSGECNCTCDSVERGKSKEEYEALILSRTLHTTVSPADLGSPEYHKLESSFRKGEDEDNGTFYFEKQAGSNRTARVKVGVPEWLASVLAGKGAVVNGPGASLQNCPNGICIGGDNSGTATVNNFGPLPLPTPNVKICASYSDAVQGQDHVTTVTFTTDVQITRPWFAVFFDAPVLDGSAIVTNAGFSGFSHGRAEKMPNPERSFWIRLDSINMGTNTWNPGDGPIKLTVPSKNRVQLVNVLGGAGENPDVPFPENLNFKCE